MRGTRTLRCPASVHLSDDQADLLHVESVPYGYRSLSAWKNGFRELICTSYLEPIHVTESVVPKFAPWRGMLALFVTVSEVELPQRVSPACARGSVFPLFFRC